jgi:hypothetical protein
VEGSCKDAEGLERIHTDRGTGGLFLFSGHETIYFIENKEKTLQASYDRGTQIFDYMD